MGLLELFLVVFVIYVFFKLFWKIIVFLLKAFFEVAGFFIVLFFILFLFLLITGQA